MKYKSKNVHLSYLQHINNSMCDESMHQHHSHDCLNQAKPFIKQYDNPTNQGAGWVIENYYKPVTWTFPKLFYYLFGLNKTSRIYKMSITIKYLTQAFNVTFFHFQLLSETLLTQHSISLIISPRVGGWEIFTGQLNHVLSVLVLKWLAAACRACSLKGDCMLQSFCWMPGWTPPFRGNSMIDMCEKLLKKTTILSI